MERNQVKEIEVLYRAKDFNNRVIAETKLQIGAGIIKTALQNMNEAKRMYKQVMTQLKGLIDSLRREGYGNI